MVVAASRHSGALPKRLGTAAPGVHSPRPVHHTRLISFVQEQNTENQRRLSQARGRGTQAVPGGPPHRGRCQPCEGQLPRLCEQE